MKKVLTRIKLMIVGAMLIALGPGLAALDIDFAGFLPACWLIGIPLFIYGICTPSSKVPTNSEDLPQKTCPECGNQHDFDFPKCPHCGHDYQAKQIK